MTISVLRCNLCFMANGQSVLLSAVCKTDSGIRKHNKYQNDTPCRQTNTFSHSAIQHFYNYKARQLAKLINQGIISYAISEFYTTPKHKK